MAEQQQGFFTAKQAKSAGFAENTHPYHVQVGNWIREHRGIYRMKQFPSADRPDLVLWSLWSRNRKEETEGVFSHQTALSLYELSDANPAKLHMTVPTHFRRNSEIPGILVLHYADLPVTDVAERQGKLVYQGDKVEDSERALASPTSLQALTQIDPRFKPTYEETLGLVPQFASQKKRLMDPVDYTVTEVTVDRCSECSEADSLLAKVSARRVKLRIRILQIILDR